MSVGDPVKGTLAGLDIWGQEAAQLLSSGRRGLMEKVIFQVQLTGRPYRILKLPEDCCDRKSSPSRLGEESATLLYAGSYQEKLGIFIPFQRHGVQYLIPERPFLALMDD